MYSRVEIIDMYSRVGNTAKCCWVGITDTYSRVGNIAMVNAVKGPKTHFSSGFLIAMTQEKFRDTLYTLFHLR